MSSIFINFLLVVLPTLSCADAGFLQHSSEQGLTAEQLSVILGAIEDTLGEKHRRETEVRIAPLQDLLAPTLKALPNNEYGKFGSKAVRYALHRLFLQRHAWYVDALDATEESGNVTSTRILQTVPDQIQSLFESKLGARGLSAHEVAVMAATFENLAYQESIERLHSAYIAANLTMGAGHLTVEQVDYLLDVYAAGFVTRKNLTQRWLEAREKGIASLLDFAPKLYPGFVTLQRFMRGIRAEATSNRSTISNLEVTRIVSRFQDKYGRWQNSECDDLKKKLLSIEDDGTGRVSLAKFYGAVVNGIHQEFEESSEYLRALGALDETNPSQPRVIITNYILSPSNCLAASKYYSVCCLDECEDLMDHVERTVENPVATPEQLAEIITTMPTSVARSNHMMTPELRRRLHEIAATKGGMVPLHSRLLKQWLHHVYPRECSYPHLSNSTSRKRSKEWQKSTGLNGRASQEDMKQCIADAAGREGEMTNEIVWSDVDEFYVDVGASPTDGTIIFRNLIKFSVLFGVVLSIMYYLMGMAREMKDQTNDNDCVKYV